MSKFLTEMKNEVKVRLSAYKRERDDLDKAAARKAELDGLIDECMSELKSLCERCPDPETEVTEEVK